MGLGNEADFTLSFGEWRERPPFRIEPRDPFALYKSELDTNEAMEEFFDARGRFVLSR